MDKMKGARTRPGSFTICLFTFTFDLLDAFFQHLANVQHISVAKIHAGQTIPFSVGAGEKARQLSKAQAKIKNVKGKSKKRARGDRQ